MNIICGVINSLNKRFFAIAKVTVDPIAKGLGSNTNFCGPALAICELDMGTSKKGKGTLVACST
jgi:hypothetical protein